jgi:hypothetical protein
MPVNVSALVDAAVLVVTLTATITVLGLVRLAHHLFTKPQAHRPQRSITWALALVIFVLAWSLIGWAAQRAYTSLIPTLIPDISYAMSLGWSLSALAVWVLLAWPVSHSPRAMAYSLCAAAGASLVALAIALFLAVIAGGAAVATFALQDAALSQPQLLRATLAGVRAGLSAGQLAGGVLCSLAAFLGLAAAANQAVLDQPRKLAAAAATRARQAVDRLADVSLTQALFARR